MYQFHERITTMATKDAVRAPYGSRVVRITKEIKHRRARMVSTFQADILAHREDAQIRSIYQARASMFRLGENVDALTGMLKERLLVLSGKVLAPRI